MRICPECKSANVIKTWADPDPEFDEYECDDCGVGLDLIANTTFVIARSAAVALPWS